MQDSDELWQAAFTSEEPSNRAKHDQHWEKILNNPTIINRTICLEDVVVGSIGRYLMDDIPQVTYWIGSEFKGQGIATEALKLFLEIDLTRPIEARTAFDNTASAKVLSKNGFVEVGQDVYFANARGIEIVETIWRLV
jgi:RimJ/RimL family protein N-acetyltransferase